MITIALADDHVLLRQSLAQLIDAFGGFQVLWQANNGLEVMSHMQQQMPDLLLLDIRMPHMDGFETCQRMAAQYPQVKVLVLTMMEEEMAVIKMLKYGARGYILKDTEAAELRQALTTLHQSGYFFNDLVTGKLVHAVQTKGDGAADEASLTDKEREFLILAATELTYKQIADQMHLSPRTIDGYRDGLFAKLNIRSRVGLAMYAVRKGLVKPSS